MSEQQKKRIGLAVASLVCGLLFWFPILGLLLGIVAVILGIIALSKIKSDAAVYGGKNMAISGIVLGGISIILIPIIALLAAIAIPNFIRARSAAASAQAQAAIKTIAVAADTYQLDHGGYPGAIKDLIDNGYIAAQTVDTAGHGVTAVFFSDSYVIAANAKDGFGYPSFCVTEDHRIHIDGQGDAIMDYAACTGLPLSESR